MFATVLFGVGLAFTILDAATLILNSSLSGRKRPLEMARVVGATAVPALFYIGAITAHYIGV